MARKPYKPDIEYIQKYYSYGTEAKVIEFKPLQNTEKPAVPRPKKQKKTTVYIDPIALCGLIVAVVMLVVMAVGVVQFSAVCAQHQQMLQYLTQLKDENVRLNHEYHTGYDLEEVRATALALGMIPVEEAQTISVQVSVPQREPEMTAWDEFIWFLSGLFA